MAFNLDKITAKLAAIPEGFDNEEAKVGWFESAQYPDGTPVAYVASIHEFGAPSQGIPPRPTMRPTVVEQKAAWVKTMEQGVRAVANGRASANDVLDAVGMQASGDIRKTISQLTSPALAPATVAARARKYKSGESTKSLEKPLVDTALMIDSLTHAVGTKE